MQRRGGAWDPEQLTEISECLVCTGDLIAVFWTEFKQRETKQEIPDVRRVHPGDGEVLSRARPLHRHSCPPGQGPLQVQRRKAALPTSSILPNTRRRGSARAPGRARPAPSASGCRSCAFPGYRPTGLGGSAPRSCTIVMQTTISRRLPVQLQIHQQSCLQKSISIACFR